MATFLPLPPGVMRGDYRDVNPLLDRDNLPVGFSSSKGDVFVPTWNAGGTALRTPAGVDVEILNYPLSGVPAILAQAGTPSGVAPSGSVGANGALTLGTALAIVHTGGLYLYFPLGALYAASPAGSYWCVMSSTTVGTAYNNVYTPGEALAPPVSATAIVAAGPGAYTGVTTTVTLASFTLPAGSMGANGWLLSDLVFTNNNSVGNKVQRQTIGGVSTGGVTTSTVTDQSQELKFFNVGSETKNQANYKNYGASSSAQASTRGMTLDTNTALVVAQTGQMATATDWVILEAHSVVLRSAA